MNCLRTAKESGEKPEVMVTIRHYHKINKASNPRLSVQYMRIQGGKHTLHLTASFLDSVSSAFSISSHIGAIVRTQVILSSWLLTPYRLTNWVREISEETGGINECADGTMSALYAAKILAKGHIHSHT
jgi:hypothetical protein